MATDFQTLTHRIVELDRVLATGISGKRRQLLIEFRREAYNTRNRLPLPKVAA